MRLFAAALPILLVTAGPAPLPPQECEVRREVTARLDAADLRGVIVTARAGSLDIRGTGDSHISVQGIICASDDELAGSAALVLERRDGAAWLEAALPDRDGMWRDYLRMDLIVTMPRALAADIDDGSGSMAVRGIAAARIEDGSGGIEVQDIAGAVEIDDGSGEVRIREAGSVVIEDGSGEVTMDGIRGDVRVAEDGSGRLEIGRVGGSVRIDDDGSGSIRINDVAGDLVILDDGSGSISHRGVQGRVELPRRR